MYIIEEPKVEEAIGRFRNADFRTREEGDRFFESVSPGNTTPLDRPFERFSDFEELLRRLRETDARKYQRIHKGTPFYYMSWLAFDLRNYEKALFYIDAGVLEDAKNNGAGWLEAPGARSLLLDPADQAAERTVLRVRKLLECELSRFNQTSNFPPLEVEGTWRTFVRKLLANTDPKTPRPIVSALYVFLLEFEDRVLELELRDGSTGGSNQPFTVHLFTGGLLLESLLKLCYTGHTLGEVLKNPKFKSDFRLSKSRAPVSFAADLKEIHDALLQNGSPVEAAFSTAAKLRNTTGHNLVWDDIFDTPQKYRDLFQAVMSALFFVIAGKFIQVGP